MLAKRDQTNGSLGREAHRAATLPTSDSLAGALAEGATQAAALGGVRALMSMPCANVGVGSTCRSILRGAGAAGYAIDLYTSRNDGPRQEPFVTFSATPWALSLLPHRFARYRYVPRLHRAYLASLASDHVAYLWPSVPYRVFHEVHARGIPIVTESINTLMRQAKLVLDAEYDRLGLRSTHRITEARIEDEEARLALTDAIFSPSPATDRSLAASSFADQALPASYGVWIGDRATVERAQRDRVTFLFIGLSSIRKGLQDLLAAWPDVPRNAHLRIVGDIDPDLLRLYPRVFGQPNVSVAGYRTDVAAEYEAADVFVLPSLEEGDPIVTYEAASWGLPLLVSQQGAGRMGATTGAARIIDTRDIALLRHWVEELTRSRDMRQALGATARQAVQAYDWNLVAKRRFDDLAQFLGQRN